MSGVDARTFINGFRSGAAGLFRQGSRANSTLTICLGLLLGVACLIAGRHMIAEFPAGIDLEIPLRAASRWMAGGEPYPPSAMLVKGGPDLPYLYPPYLLPLIAPFTGLPRDVVTAVWLALCAILAAWTCRRLGIPWLVIPCVLAWPPFSEGLVTGNVQILSFAAFVALLYEPVAGVARQRALVPARDVLNGCLAAAVGALKVAQSLPLLYLLGRRWRSAVLGSAVLAMLALAMLPFTGSAVYGEWLAQMGRAADPTWTVGGVAFGRTFGLPDVLLAGCGLAIALAARGRDSAAWLGIGLLVATPSVHGYTFLFLIPTLITMRRDLSFVVAAMYLGNYHTETWWPGFLLAVGCLLAANRWPSLRANVGPRMGRETESVRPGSIGHAFARYNSVPVGDVWIRAGQDAEARAGWSSDVRSTGSAGDSTSLRLRSGLDGRGRAAGGVRAVSVEGRPGRRDEFPAA